jgi:hypothetical protein
MAKAPNAAKVTIGVKSTSHPLVYAHLSRK